MLSSAVPVRFPIPFANAAAGIYVRSVPEASQIGIQDGAASLTDGFPPLTFVPVAAGGVPPWGADFNGLLFQITKWAQWQAAGGPVLFNSAFSTAIGGYPKSALLASTTLGRLWMSQVESNTVDPDAGASANWRDIAQGRLVDVQVFPSAGTFSYTPVAGVRYLRVRGAAAGGAGGGTALTSGSQIAVGGGGGAGSTGEVWIASNGSGTTITVGAAGVAVSGAAGGAGGASSFGTYLVMPGGSGGGLGAAQSVLPYVNGGANGGSVPSSSGCTIILQASGEPGGVGFGMTLTNAAGGQGGSAQPFGSGATPPGPGVGNNAQGWGAGGSGACALPSTAAQIGGLGAPGKIIVEGYS